MVNLSNLPFGKTLFGNKERETTPQPVLSPQEQVVKSRFSGDAGDPKWLWEGAGAELYRKIIESGVYWPGEIEHKLIAEHREELWRRMRDVFVMLGAGDGAKEKTLLDGFPGLANLHITGLEASMGQAVQSERTFKEFADDQHIRFARDPAFHTISLDEAKAATFASRHRQRLTYTSLGFNIGMRPTEVTEHQLAKLFRTHLTGKDDTFIFSYFSTPTSDAEIQKTKQIYFNAPSEEFVMSGIERVFAGLPRGASEGERGYVFDRSQRIYDVHYNTETSTIEIGVIPNHDGEVALSDGTILSYQAQKKVTVYKSKRFSDYQIRSLVESAGLSLRSSWSQEGVVLAVADARRKAHMVREHTAIGLTIVLALGLWYVQAKNQEDKRIAQNFERFKKIGRRSDEPLTFVDEYVSFDLEGDSLLQWREKTAHELTDICQDMYGGGESLTTQLYHSIYDLMPEIEKTYLTQGDKYGFDQMYVLTNVIFPRIRSTLAAEGANTYPYAELDGYEVQIFNTLFPDEHIPTPAESAQTVYGGGEAMSEDYTHHFDPCMALSGGWSRSYVAEFDLYSNGVQMLVKGPWSKDQSTGAFKQFKTMAQGYEGYEAGHHEQDVLRDMLYWKYPILQRVVAVLGDRLGYSRGGSDTEHLAHLFVDYWFRGYVKGGPFAGYDPYAPLPWQIDHIVACFEVELTHLKGYPKEFPFQTVPNKHAVEHREAFENMLSEPWKKEMLDGMFVLPYGVNVQDLHTYGAKEIGLYVTRTGMTYYLFEVRGRDGRPYLMGSSAERDEGSGTWLISPVLTAVGLEDVICDMLNDGTMLSTQ